MKKRGWGLGCMWYGIGNTGMPNPSGAFVDILDDATVVLLTGCADIGQGSNTVLAQIVAEELGVELDKISVISADTWVTPDGGATSASRQTYISGNAVKKAAEAAKKPLLEKAASLLKVPESEIEFRGCKVFPRFDPDCALPMKNVIQECRREGRLTLGHGSFNPLTTGLDEEGQGNPYATYAFATQWAEVEVDTETGEVTVLKIVASHDVGRAINPKMIEGQIEGGCLMGLGYALMEEIITDKGTILNPGLSNYLIPTIADVPEIISLITEDEEDTGPFGAKGVGEPPLIPTAPAILNAVSNALGIRFTELPLTPEKILSALEEKE
ncbi:MAG: xanthine dehydrogenase family protein molybdopterin-binding subunit [Dethiobacteria bacterium]|jgi:CO/xanthine dehydrogenase Mo-binding subunit